MTWYVCPNFGFLISAIMLGWWIFKITAVWTFFPFFLGCFCSTSHCFFYVCGQKANFRKLSCQVKICSNSAVCVCVYFTVSKHVYLHTWMNSPHYHTQTLHVPEAVALSTSMIWGQRDLICLSCPYMFIFGNYYNPTVLVLYVWERKGEGSWNECIIMMIYIYLMCLFRQ